MRLLLRITSHLKYLSNLKSKSLIRILLFTNVRHDSRFFSVEEFTSVEIHGKTLLDFVRDARARMREISVEGFDEMIENHDDVLVVDVREPEEFHRGHFHRCAILLRSKDQGAPSMVRPFGGTMVH